MTSTPPPPDYRPNASEPFMSPMQRAYFRQKLLRWRESLLQESSDTVHHLRQAGQPEPDPDRKSGV